MGHDDGAPGRFQAAGVRPAGELGAVRVKVEPDRRARVRGQFRDEAPGRPAVHRNERADHRRRGVVAPGGGVADDARSRRLPGPLAGLEHDDPVREARQAGEDRAAVGAERGAVQREDRREVRLGSDADVP
jgi:hypothetical protein